MSATPGSRDRFKQFCSRTMADAGVLELRRRARSADPDALWITEVWKDEASHKGSLALPAVHAPSPRRSLIAGFSNRVVTIPIGGIGLVGRASLAFGNYCAPRTDRTFLNRVGGVTRCRPSRRSRACWPLTRSSDREIVAPAEWRDVAVFMDGRVLGKGKPFRTDAERSHPRRDPAIAARRDRLAGPALYVTTQLNSAVCPRTHRNRRRARVGIHPWSRSQRTTSSSS